MVSDLYFWCHFKWTCTVDAEEGPLYRRSCESDSDSVPHGIHESFHSLEDPSHWDNLIRPSCCDRAILAQMTQTTCTTRIAPVTDSEYSFMRPLPCGIHRGSVTCVRVRACRRMSRAAVRVIQARGPQRRGRVSLSCHLSLYLFVKNFQWIKK